MPTVANTGDFLEGAFELAFGELAVLNVAGIEPEVAIASASVVSPDAAGGITPREPAVAIADAVVLSPDVIGGVTSHLPAVAIAAASVIVPLYVPKRRAIKGVFGCDPSIIADEFEAGPWVVADQFDAGVRL